MTSARAAQAQPATGTETLTPGEAAAVAGVVAVRRPSATLVVGSLDAATAEALATHSVTVVEVDEAQVTALREGAAVDLVYIAADVPTVRLGPVLEALLSGSRARQAIWLVAGAAEAERRAALEAVHPAAWASVQQVDLDFVAGHVRTDPAHRYALMGGLARLVTDDSRPPRAGARDAGDRYPTAHVLRRGRDLLAATDTDLELPALPEQLREIHLLALRAATDAQQLAAVAQVRDLQREHEQLLARYLIVVNSTSWRITAPLRWLLTRLRRGA